MSLSNFIAGGKFYSLDQVSKSETIKTLKIGDESHFTTHSVDGSDVYTVSDSANRTLIRFNNGSFNTSSILGLHIQNTVAPVSRTVADHSTALASHAASLSSHSGRLDIIEAGGGDSIVGQEINDLQAGQEALEIKLNKMIALLKSILNVGDDFNWDSYFA